MLKSYGMNIVLQLMPQWALIPGYIILFLTVVVMGPALTAAGAFAARLGFYDIWVVLIISVLGNLTPDIIFYAIGYWGRERIITSPLIRRLGGTRERIEVIENHYRKNGFKTILAAKMIPLTAIPGLIAAGVVRVPIKKYVIWNLIIIIPTSVFYLFLGYYLGEAYKIIIKRIEYGEYAALAILFFSLLIYYAYSKSIKEIGERIEKTIEKA